MHKTMIVNDLKKIPFFNNRDEDEIERLKKENKRLKELLDEAVPCDERCSNPIKWENDVESILIPTN